MIRIFLIFFGWIVWLNLVGQHTPLITNYKASDYQAHHQNWAITQSPDRILYAANTNGLLAFNGNSWTLSKTKSNKIIRSVFARGKRIYTGSYEEIGFWEPDICGQMDFINLTPSIPEEMVRNEEFWNITASQKHLFFQSFSILLAYDGKTFIKIDIPGSIMFLNICDNKGYIQALDHGIYAVDEKLKVKLLENTNFFNNKIISGICTYHDNHSLLITTLSDGVFLYKDGNIKPWRSDLSAYFKTAQINKVLLTREKKLLFGTISDGVLLFDAQDELKYHINISNGIQNNTVLSIFEDSDQNIWLGLDKGISRVDFSQKLMQFKDIRGLIGSVYTIAKIDSTLYLGTNQGVYYHDIRTGVLAGTDPPFQLVDGTQGQVWQLFPVGDQIFCGHNDGSLLIKKNKSKKISAITGGWYNEFIPGSDSSFILQGNYTGLSLFGIKGSNIYYVHRIEGYAQPVKKFIIQGNYVWVINQNSGLKRLLLNKDYKKVLSVKEFGKKQGLRQTNNLDLIFFNNKIYIWDGDSHYYYDAKSGKFFPDQALNSYEKGFIIRPLNDSNWLRIYPNQAVRMSGNKSVNQIPYIFNKDYHNVVELDQEHFAYCLDDGYMMLEKNALHGRNLTDQDSIFIRLHQKDGFCFPFPKNKTAEIKYKQNEIAIRFWDTHFNAAKTYKYRLLPISKDWKSIDNGSQIKFDNLDNGKYRVEILRDDGVGGNIDFVILPPWYLSVPAFLFYVLMGLSALFAVNRFYSKKIQHTRNKLLAEKARMMREHTMELENQRLMTANQFKNKELANVTLHLIQKNEILQDIKGELIQIKNLSEHKLLSRDIQTLLKQINHNLTLEKDKKLFDTSFDEVHENFIKILKHHFPSLTHEDLKLAAFLRMNLTSKEIAPLFNISLRGLENKRYRLRKKLGLSHDDSLQDFFDKIEI